ncbi:MAG TPA: AAA family ATPase [Panacibacter sp.]|nr:AAA family ATPase [Panacibacter sp.]
MNLPASPFKFLDSYQQGDRDVFFGRDKEINDLYNALSGVKQLLLYGPSGSGKTSLIECGLRNQFSDADWFALTIRRGRNLNESFFKTINEILQDKIELDEKGLPKEKRINFGQTIEALFSELYQPIYLLFDQFEELLILGDEAEKIEFFTRLNQLVRFKVPCRVILIMREEFIGYLSEYEYLCPSLFQHRFRLEKMGKKYVKEVIDGILTTPYYHAFFIVENADALSKAVLDRMPKQEIELAHIQVFFGELWNRALEQRKGDKIPKLHPGLIKETDKLEEVLNDFLKDQIEKLKPKYGENAPLEVLVAMITDRDTKLQIDEKTLQKDLDSKGVQLQGYLAELLADLTKARITRDIKIDDDVKYEISHDILARVVGQNRTQDMKLRQEAERIYSVIQLKDRTSFLSADDLKLLLPYEKFHTPEIKTWIADSEKYNKAVEQKELVITRKRLRNIRGLLFAALFALVVAGVGLWYATNQKKIADKNLANFKIEQAAKDSIRFNELYSRANTILKEDAQPLEILDSMKSINFVYDTASKMKWMRKAIDSTTRATESKQSMFDSTQKMSDLRAKK